LEEWVRLYLIASKPTDSVIFGFLPAAARLGLDVVLLTDQPAEHERALARSRLLPRPGCLPAARDNRAVSAPVQMVRCDVWDAAELISAIAARPAPDAVFSNSDHLQTQAALAATYFGVPGKDWRLSMRAKNKPLMRHWLAGTGTEQVAVTEIRPDTRHPLPPLAFPVVLKPSAGVASEDVMLVDGPDELARQCTEIFARRPGETLLAEEYLPGELHTLETIGDGVTTWVLGGFRTQLSSLPFFIEERLTWENPVPKAAKGHLLAALAGLGGTFGACHTEYVLDAGRGPALIEVNDRLIGDHCDFVLADLLGVDLFELVLRVHLGESLPSGTPPVPPPGAAHAVIDYVVADQPGVLTSAPARGPQPAAEAGVTLSCWPLRAVGDRIAVTNTNRDYLGVITAIGSEPSAVEVSVTAMRAAGRWQITDEPRP
jgi:biotin carboxylase